MSLNIGPVINALVATAGPLVVIVVRMLGSGPGTASAGSSAVDSNTAADLLSQVRSTPELRGAWEQSVATWQQPSRAQALPVAPTPTLPIDAPEVPRVTPPRLTLTAVLGTARRGAAVLDERIYWLGDDLGHGWALDRVDQQRRTVTLRHETGVTHLIEFAEDD